MQSKRLCGLKHGKSEEKSMKVSDYVAQFLVNRGIDKLFLISGGGMMHLLDSVGKQAGLECIFNLNEQASAICAESWAQYSGRMGACMVTTGPGATNAVTGCAGAWVDGTPVMYISGQCRIEQMGQLKGLRIYGAQEIAIVPMVKPITKYAVTVLKAEDIRYHLEKAAYLASHGRKGPVWIDIPLDIQGSQVDLGALRAFDPEEENADIPAVKPDQIKKVYSLINQARRPVILIGHGVVASNRQEQIREFVNFTGIPVLATWRAKGVFGDEEELFFGSPGVPAVRSANYVLQNADFLLIIGTRLNPAVTAYDEPHFAYQARKVIVDIEREEIEKLNIRFEMGLVCDAGEFIDAMLKMKALYTPNRDPRWLPYCTSMKKKYPLRKEKQPVPSDCVDGFHFAAALSERSRVSDVFVGSSSGRSCGVSHMAYRIKRGQRFVTSMGLGSMGWCVPSAIACCIASGKRRTLVIEGDGSLQHNIQELALIRAHDLPLKLFIFSNGGYASIYGMQKNNFQGRFTGCTPESGVVFPHLSDIAHTYDLKYFCIRTDNEIGNVLDEVMSDDTPCLCELRIDINFDEIPKSMTIANPDGTFSSSKLENLYPFLDKAEQQDNMPDWSMP